MPEGPEVRVVSDVIRRAVGKTVSAARIVENVPGIDHRFTKDGIPNLVALQGATLKEVKAFGKLLCLTFERGPGEVWQMLNTLGMSGSWAWNGSSYKHARLNLSFADETSIAFIDARCFGTIRIMTPSLAAKEIKKIGFDLLDAPMPEDQWAALQTKKGLTDLPVGEALLVQKHFSGIGNIYKSETLYACCIDPRVLVKDLPKEDWGSINHAANKILQKAYKLGGSSVESFQADGKDGDMQNHLAIYGMGRCPEGHETSHIDQSGRTTWFCETCVANWKVANEQNQACSK